MASPQLENGYTQIANELLEAVALVDLTKRQLKIVLAIIRRTYGWGKKADTISTSQLSNMTSIDARDVRRTLNELVKKNVISSTKTKQGHLIELNKDYESWSNYKPQQIQIETELTVNHNKREKNQQQKVDKVDNDVVFKRHADMLGISLEDYVKRYVVGVEDLSKKLNRADQKSIGTFKHV